MHSIYVGPICVNVNKVGLHVATNTLGANNRPKFTR